MTGAQISPEVTPDNDEQGSRGIAYCVLSKRLGQKERKTKQKKPSLKNYFYYYYNITFRPGVECVCDKMIQFAVKSDP